MTRMTFKGYQGFSPSDYCEIPMLKKDAEYWIAEDESDRHGDVKVLIEGRFYYEKKHFFSPIAE